eukprot:710034_1
MTNKRFCHLQKILDLHHSLLEPVPAQAQAQAKTDTPSFHDGDCNHVKLSSPRVEIGKLKEPASAIDLITELFVSDASKRSNLGESDAFVVTTNAGRVEVERK